MAEKKSNMVLNFDEFPPVSTEEWEQVIQKDLKGKNFKKELLWQTLEGVDVLPFYRRNNLKDLAHEVETIQKTASWNVIEKIDIPDLKKANKQVLTALQNGASGVLLDVPASSIKSKTDLSLLLEDIQIEFISIHFGTKLSSPKISSWFTELCKDREVNEDSLTVTFSYDPFVQALQTGKLPHKTELISFFDNFDTPHKIFPINGDFYGNCGGSIIQQIAFALAEGNEYLALTDDLNKDISEVASGIHFNFSTASSYFLEIAKYRAFRLVWRQVLSAYENDLPDAAQVYIHAKTASWNKASSDAHNNMIRATTEAMSAAIGGCNAITIERFDEDFADHSDFSARMARNTQLILQGEAYLDKVSDAGAGSYYIEELTDSLARESWKLFQEIEQHGGFYESIKNGFIQQQLSSSQSKRKKAYLENNAVLVGVNKYKAEKDQDSKKTKTTKNEISPFKEFHTVDTVPKLNIEDTLNNGENL